MVRVLRRMCSFTLVFKEGCHSVAVTGSELELGYVFYFQSVTATELEPFCLPINPQFCGVCHLQLQNDLMKEQQR